MMRRLLLLLPVGLGLLAAAPLAAQRAITAGMTTDEVRAVFGAPNVVRQADGWTYFFYPNRCLPRCGTDDTVFFRDGRVVAAVLHSPARRYTGEPAASALGAVAEPPGTATTGAAVTGIRVRGPGDVEERPVNLGVISGRPEPAAPADTLEAPRDTGFIERVDTIMLPVGTDPERQLRERRVEPTTVRQDPAPPAEPADPRAREERIEPNTIRRRP